MDARTGRRSRLSPSSARSRGKRAKLSRSGLDLVKELGTPTHEKNVAMLIANVLFLAVLALEGCQTGTEVLPAPTGPHPTGRMSFHWKDTARAELETRAADDKRELMVHVFYPANAGARGSRAAYMPDADAMHPPWDNAQLARISAMRAYSIENAELPRGDARYPVVVVQPGGGMKGLTYHLLMEDLASHGWVVVAIDPPYNARAVRLPDGRVLGNLAPAEQALQQPRNPAEGERFYLARVAHMARDISFAIDQLTALDRGNGPFARRLDIERGVGALGHSRGGQAAGTVRLIDPRVRGAINLDGTAGPYGGFLPIEGDSGSGAPPFLWIVKAQPAPPSAEQLQRAGRTRAQYDSVIQQMMARWDRRMSDVTRGAMRVDMVRPGIEHIDFSDEPFWDGLMTPETRPGKLQTIAETRAWVRAFFDGTVRGDWAELKRLAGQAGVGQPEVTATVFGRLWPE